MTTGRSSKQDRRRKSVKRHSFYDHETARASFASRRFIDEKPGPATPKFSEGESDYINLTFFVRQNLNRPAKNGGRSNKRPFLQTAHAELWLPVDLSVTKLEPAKFTENLDSRKPTGRKGKNGSGIRRRTCASGQRSFVHQDQVCQAKPDAESDIITELQHGLRGRSFLTVEASEALVRPLSTTDEGEATACSQSYFSCLSRLSLFLARLQPRL
ncbi:unnamed protein product [Trichogramma brassicae]|uniref:Uncharacterized protein n=1 Tax=Trichogramma brassicae TaxID=86971 RepID=A0A6H5J4M8_9HYME|nr:unnamed protein product [Trichogramma brassicae]